MKKLLWILLFLPFTVNAFEILSVDTVGVSVQYTEPTLNADGSPLTDLDHTEVFYDMGQGEVKAIDIVATSPSGGGTVSMQIPVTVNDGQEIDISFYSKAVDGSGNISAPSPTAVIRIDRLAPAAPQ